MEREALKESILHGTPAFPIAIYNYTFAAGRTTLARLHYHGEFELLTAVRGAFNVQIEQETYTLNEGEGLFINSEKLHRIDAVGHREHEFIAVVFNYSLLCNEDDAVYCKYIYPLMRSEILVPKRLPKTIVDTVSGLVNVRNEAGFGYELFIKRELTDAFFKLLSTAKPQKSVALTVKSGLVKDVIDFIENDFAKELTLAAMAERVHVSKEYLCRVFSSMTGTSPIVYLNRYRIKKSAVLLADTHKKISDISLSCGFNNSSYFNKLFLRYMGCTPNEYRKNKKDG